MIDAMNFGPFTGWTSGESVYLRVAGAMACLTSHRKISTSVPVPLRLLSLERVEDDTCTEVWLVEGPDGGRYVTTAGYLTKSEPDAPEEVSYYWEAAP